MTKLNAAEIKSNNQTEALISEAEDRAKMLMAPVLVDVFHWHPDALDRVFGTKHWNEISRQQYEAGYDQLGRYDILAEELGRAADAKAMSRYREAEAVKQSIYSMKAKIVTVSSITVNVEGEQVSIPVIGSQQLIDGVKNALLNGFRNNVSVTWDKERKCLVKGEMSGTRLKALAMHLLAMEDF